MTETLITRREAKARKKWDRHTGSLHTFRLRPFQGLLLEVEDVHFHHDSAVLLPDFEPTESAPDTPEHHDRITGLAVLRACYIHAKQNPDQKMLITGHTDTTGAGGYNLTLSKMRADSVLHVLLGNRDAWVQIAHQKHKVEDYQQILKWVAKVKLWNCDPGAIDNQPGPKTQAATKEFQKTYNREFGASIGEDGIVGRQTWGAFFDLYMDVLKDSFATDDAGLGELRQGLHFLNDGQKDVGCGENFPIEMKRFDNYRSSINRRVEILFFDPGEEPQLNCHTSGGACVPAACELYNPAVYNFRHIPVQPIRVLSVYKIRLFDELAQPLPFAPFVVSAGTSTHRGRAKEDAFITIRDLEVPAKCHVKWSRAGPGENEDSGPPDPAGAFEFALDVFVDIQDDDEERAALERLHNLGYTLGPTQADDVKLFQQDYKSRFSELTENGELDAPTKDALRNVHNDCDPLPKTDA